VEDAGAEVAGGVDGKPCRPAKRKADAEDQNADEIGPERGRHGVMRVEDHENAEKQDCGRDRLGQEIEAIMPNGRLRGKAKEFQSGILCLGPMGEITAPD